MSKAEINATQGRGELYWFKSSYSGPSGGGACVETAVTGDGMAMRHSKNPGGIVLWFDASNWNAFLDELREGAHSLS